MVNTRFSNCGKFTIFNLIPSFQFCTELINTFLATVQENVCFKTAIHYDAIILNLVSFQLIIIILFSGGNFIWDYFTLNKDQGLAQCKICLRCMNHKNGSYTRNLDRHLATASNVHGKAYKELLDRRNERKMAMQEMFRVKMAQVPTYNQLNL